MELEKLIDAYRVALSNEDGVGLREIITQIQRKYSGNENSDKSLWLRLLKLGIELTNIELTKISVELLGATEVLSTLDYLSKNSNASVSLSDSLSYIIDFFKLPDYKTAPNATISPHLKLKTEVSMTNKMNYEAHSSLLSSMRQARFFELEEDYNSALEKYEESSTHTDHAVRLILKNHQTSSYTHIKQYLRRDINGQAVLARFATVCGDTATALENFDLLGDQASKVWLTSEFFGLQAAEKLIIHEPLVKSGAFDLSNNNTESETRQKLRSLAIAGSSLSCGMRRALFQLARLNHYYNQVDKACSLYLCLGQNDIMLQLSDGLARDKKLSLHLWSSFCGTTRALYTLVAGINNRSCSKSEDDFGRTACDGAFKMPLLYLKLGLFDEVLSAISSHSTRDDSSYIPLVIETLESMIRRRDLRNLADVDPYISPQTLERVYSEIVYDQSLNTNVITIVMLCCTVFLMKISDTNPTALGQDIERLECIFEPLPKFTHELKFNASGSILKSINFLILAIKEKLSFISDSDIIRESFGGLVVAIAKRCMVEGQYKNAAMLYSSIEDNVNAVKSLMRTGEIDIVINFSLLVKDISVKRITINYLRHHGVDESVIEDFIARSKD